MNGKQVTEYWVVIQANHVISFQIIDKFMLKSDLSCTEENSSKMLTWYSNRVLDIPWYYKYFFHKQKCWSSFCLLLASRGSKSIIFYIYGLTQSIMVGHVCRPSWPTTIQHSPLWSAIVAYHSITRSIMVSHHGRLWWTMIAILNVVKMDKISQRYVKIPCWTVVDNDRSWWTIMLTV